MSYATLMVHLNLGVRNDDLLEATAHLARRLDATVIGIAACQPMPVLYSEGYFPAEIYEQDRTEIEKAIAAAKEACVLKLESCKAIEWRASYGYFPLADYLGAEASGADLLLVSPVPENAPFASAPRCVDLGDLVMRAGRPVLIVPEKWRDVPLDHAMICWKNTREARRAVADALPLLQRADRVSIVALAEESALVETRNRVANVREWLNRHGVESTATVEPIKGKGAAQLDAIAADRNANLLVAGAYGHSRLREWVLGGVTKDLLSQPKRAMLLSH